MMARGTTRMRIDGICCGPSHGYRVSELARSL